MLTTSKGFGRGASSACHVIAATRSAVESAWCNAPIVCTWKNPSFSDVKRIIYNFHSSQAQRWLCILWMSLSVPWVSEVIQLPSFSSTTTVRMWEGKQTCGATREEGGRAYNILSRRFLWRYPPSQKPRDLLLSTRSLSIVIMIRSYH